MNQDFDCCQKDTKIITDRLDQLGFKINQEQSVLILLRSSSFIGFTTCSARFIVGTRPRAIDF